MPKKSNVFYRGRPPHLLTILTLHPTPLSRLAVYSTTARSDTTGDHDLSWPTVTPFTPYDIFKQKREAPYSKARYYDLVKIYHPDRPCHGHPLCRDISPEVRLHRYRLVVAAHEILSDPRRRRVYDQFGAGWNYRTGTSDDEIAKWENLMHRRHGPIYANATWEDWERYYHPGGNPEKQQQSVDQRAFTTLLVLLTLFGSAVQLTMIGQQRTGYEQRIRDVNERSVRFLTGRREGHTSTDVRVKQFLIHRDPSGFGLKEEEQGVYRDLLSPDSVSPGKRSRDPREDWNEGKTSITSERKRGEG